MTRPTPRLALVALSCLVLGAVGAGCSPGGSSAVSSSKMSEPRLESAPELAVPEPDELQDSLDSLDEGLDDLGELGDDLGLGEYGDCVQLTLGYSQLVVLAFQGEDGQAEADEIVADLRAVLPPELIDDVDVIADKVVEAGEGDWLDATGVLSDPEFREANESIGQWLQTECGG